MSDEKYEYIDKIMHRGVVASVDERAAEVTVRITGDKGCCGCPAARICGHGDVDTDTMTVKTLFPSRFSPGDNVELTGTERMHRRAIMLATVFPSLSLIAVMVGVYVLTCNQLAAVLSGLGATVVFFVVLYLCRDKIAHEFSFTITRSGV